MTPCQCYIDPRGDIHVAGGVVMQMKTGVRIPFGGPGSFSEAASARSRGTMWPAPTAAAATFIGGSGRNIIATGLDVPVSGAVPPVGIFRPGRPDVYSLGVFTLTVSGASAAAIHDGTDDVALLTAGGTAPVGSYAATAYGKTTYNGGADFTITTVAETGAPGAIPDYVLRVNSGTAQTGVFSATDSANYASDEDPDWTIVVASDGSAELLYDGSAMAVRASGPGDDPSGSYLANEAGKTAYNAGDDWTALVTVQPRLPVAGFVYLQCTEAAGVLTAVAGPFFAASLPADSGGNYHVPLLQSDGTAVEQFHLGALLWPG